MKIPMTSGEQVMQRAMRILIKIKDGEYLVEIVDSDVDAMMRCRSLGAQNWNVIGWQEQI